MQKRQLWYLLLHGKSGSENAFFGNFYAYGDHLGDAMEEVVSAAKDYNYSDLALTEASLLNTFDEIDDPQELDQLSEHTFIRQPIYSYPQDGSDDQFIPPVGIIKSVEDGEYDYELIKEGFAAYQANENGVFQLELVVDNRHIAETFDNLIELLPSVDGFWIYILDFWEDALSELWVAKHFIEKDIVIKFLASQQKEVVQNGYLDVVVHSSKGETNLYLESHKKIQLFTKDENLFKNFIRKLMVLGYTQTTDFYSLEFGYYHHHYRPGSSLSRDDFKQMLIDNNFELLKEWSTQDNGHT